MNNRWISAVLAVMVILTVLMLGACSGRQDSAGSPVASASIFRETAPPMAGPAADADPEENGTETAPQSSQAQEEGGLTSFETTDLDGNAVTQELFAGYDLTMVNIWATFCSPCIEEMPELGELKSEYQDKGVNIVGIVADVQLGDGSIPEEGVAFAKEIVAQTGANYTHLLPSASLNTLILNNVAAVPTTVFVDSKGNFVGEQYVGSRDKQEWAGIIEELLK